MRKLIRLITGTLLVLAGIRLLTKKRRRLFGIFPRRHKLFGLF